VRWSDRKKERQTLKGTEKETRSKEKERKRDWKKGIYREQDR
jgi:hypothetical protein